MGLFSQDGFEASGCRVMKGTMDAERFLSYVQDTLVHHLCPYTGEDSPLGSVLVLDNARNHWSDGVIEAIESTGYVCIFCHLTVRI